MLSIDWKINVTLEWVLYYLEASWVMFIYNPDNGFMNCCVCDEQGEPKYQGWGEDETEAACAALLVSIKE